MNRRVCAFIAACLVAFVVGSAVAWAQTTSAEIGFPFVANGKEMAAGKYAIEVTASWEASITGPDRQRILMQAITLLGRHDKDTEPEIVFDKTGGKLVLSEIWMPGKDGLLLVATKGPHEHAVLGGSNPKK